MNNRIDHTRNVGIYEDPQFIVNIDPKTNLPRATEVSGFETVYEHPWVPGIVEKWLEQDNFNLDDHCMYIVKTVGEGGGGTRTYGGFTYEQFCNESFEDLVSIGMYGKKTPSSAALEEKKQQDKIRRRAIVTAAQAVEQADAKAKQS